MRVMRTEAPNIDHPFLSNRRNFFDDRVMKLLHRDFFPGAGNYMEILAQSKEKGLLPYLADGSFLNVAIMGPLEASLKNIPPQNGTEIIAVPVNKSQSRVLKEDLALKYGYDNGYGD